MRLYHGSNLIVSQIDLSLCRPYKDFGQGFYLTTLREQAERMAQRTALVFGGIPITSVFDFDEQKTEELSTLEFNDVTRDWAQFVVNNRSRSFRDFSSALNNHDNKYDMVIGPVANDDLALLFRQFSTGLIDLDILAKGLEFKHLNDQYSFHTNKGIALLEYIGANDDQ
ncbi:MAG: DUF3990 domain-containing protein [Coriobacteriales bacterium]|jgi:hypothetical protein|nr:DUF3990 domain-containing protein [Coriobacteriales bacterium]